MMCIISDSLILYLEFTSGTYEQKFDSFIKDQSNTVPTQKQKVVFEIFKIIRRGTCNLWNTSNDVVMGINMSEARFYLNDPTAYQDAMTHFIGIIKHAGPHIHTLTVDTGSTREPSIIILVKQQMGQCWVH